MDDFTAELCHVDAMPMIIFFRVVKLQDIKRPNGYVDLLLGVHEARLFMTFVLQSVDSLLL